MFKVKLFFESWQGRRKVNFYNYICFPLHDFCLSSHKHVNVGYEEVHVSTKIPSHEPEQ